jgi:hypothetical protein
MTQLDSRICLNKLPAASGVREGLIGNLVKIEGGPAAVTGNETA